MEERTRIIREELRQFLDLANERSKTWSKAIGPRNYRTMLLLLQELARLLEEQSKQTIEAVLLRQQLNDCRKEAEKFKHNMHECMGKLGAIMYEYRDCKKNLRAIAKAVVKGDIAKARKIAKQVLGEEVEEKQVVD